ncbi:ABC transporter permease [Acetobacteraceae bacterium H6797]|nr:ABC transporter permease [Acetobacteraceae bacterium H6797]
MGFLFRRLLGVVPTLAGVVFATFALTRLLPGDPAVFFANSVTADAATIAAVREKLGLDLPLWRQFLIYVQQLFHGDLGQSISTGQPVAADLWQRLPASLELTLAAFLIALCVAIPLGIAAALRPGSIVDQICRVISTAGVSLPTFVTGLLLIYLFYYLTGLAPEPIGRIDPFAMTPPRVTGLLLIDTLLAGDTETFWMAAKQIILPALTMALFALAPLARMTRASMLGVLSSEFIRTARANGLRRRKIIFSYALRNALLPIVTTLGMIFSNMLGANVLVERVFAWPGVGSYALDSLIQLDYAPVQGFMLVMAAIFVLVNLVIDLLYGVIDPRTGLLHHA